jgi:hypothetical protein
MLGRIVEVSNDKRHLSVYRGFMLVHSTGEDRQEVGRVPLDEIAVLITASATDTINRRNSPARRSRHNGRAPSFKPCIQD